MALVRLPNGRLTFETGGGEPISLTERFLRPKKASASSPRRVNAAYASRFCHSSSSSPALRAALSLLPRARTAGVAALELTGRARSASGTVGGGPHWLTDRLLEPVGIAWPSAKWAPGASGTAGPAPPVAIAAARNPATAGPGGVPVGSSCTAKSWPMGVSPGTGGTCGGITSYNACCTRPLAPEESKLPRTGAREKSDNGTESGPRIRYPGLLVSDGLLFPAHSGTNARPRWEGVNARAMCNVDWSQIKGTDLNLRHYSHNLRNPPQTFRVRSWLRLPRFDTRCSCLSRYKTLQF